MKKITAADLLRLGFNKVDVPPEDNDGEEGYFYFIFNPDNIHSHLYSILITGDENPKDDTFTVEFTELDDIVVIKDLDDLESLVDIIKRNLTK